MLETGKKYFYWGMALFFVLFLALMFEGQNAAKLLQLDPLITLPNAIICAAVVFYFCVRVEMQSMLVLCIISSIIIAVIDKFNLITVLFLSSIWVGFLSFTEFKKRRDESDYIFIFTGLFLFLFISLLLVHAVVYKVDLIKMTNNFIQLNLSVTKQNFIDPAINDPATGSEKREALLAFWQNYKARYPYYIMGAILAFYVFGFYGLFYIIRRASKYITDKPQPFSQFKIKDAYILLFIAGCALEIIVYLQKIESLRYISRTILLYTIIVYSIQGFVIISYYLNKMKVGIFWRIFTWFWVLVYFYWIPIGLGIFDMWFNFRKFINKIEERRNESNTP